MSDKSSEMQMRRDEIFTSKYCVPKYSSNGAYQMFSEGFDTCLKLMSEREANLKKKLDLALSSFKNHALDCSESTVCIYERLLDKLEAIK